MDLTKEELKELEKQLSCPEGNEGVAVAQVMNETNIKMSISSIQALSLKENDFVLEIGHGNCGHLEKVFTYGRNISYFGLEISKTMKLEAERINNYRVLTKNASFYLYNGSSIPFSDQLFDRVMSVNTIYFLSQPKEFFNEVGRALKKNGIFVLTFVKSDSMKDLPFVQSKFRLYDKKKIRELVKETVFSLSEFIDKKEVVKSKSGELINRCFIITKLIKK